MIIRMPYKFTPREYQKARFKAFFVDNIKRLLLTEHRRAGKDTTALNMCAGAAAKEVGIYYYLFPQLNQVRKAIWNNINKDGQRFLDYFPKELIDKVNNTEMSIRYRNGSIIQMAGSDNYDALMGTNPKGIVLSEYSLQNPAAWDYLRPILIENGGWAIFTQTPRGKNHGYDLHQKTEHNSKWFNSYLTVEHTTRHDGSPVISKEMIQEEIDAGMPEEMVAQEFYLDWNAGIVGAIYGPEMIKAQADKRICKFKIEPSVPVYTFWDLGVSDYTAIWFMQPVSEQLRMVHYLQDNRKGMNYYLDKLQEVSRKFGFGYGGHYVPFDIAKQDFSSGLSAYQIAQQRGINLTVVPSFSGCVAEGIGRARAIFDRVWFHEDHAHYGIEAMRSYQTEWVEKDRVYKKQPRHDWASHGADGFRTFAMGWKDSITESAFFRQKVTYLKLGI